MVYWAKSGGSCNADDMAGLLRVQPRFSLEADNLEADSQAACKREHCKREAGSWAAGNLAAVAVWKVPDA